MAAGEVGSMPEGEWSSMAENPQMTVGERLDLTFGSNDPRRRDSTVGVETTQAESKSLKDKIMRVFSRNSQ